MHTYFARFQAQGKEKLEKAAYFGVKEKQKESKNGYTGCIMSVRNGMPTGMFLHIFNRQT